jgi:hypothetical protein
LKGYINCNFRALERLSIHITSANAHDVTAILNLLIRPIVRRPKTQYIVHHLCTDKAYDSEPLRTKLRRRRFKPHIRKREYGSNPPTPPLEAVAADKRTRWKRLVVQEWYGEKRRVIAIASRTAIWFHSGQPPVPIRWVLIRDPKKRFKTQALLCTDIHIAPEQILQWFVRRWQIEVTFHEVRTHLGVETQRHWADLSILRITPALLGTFSLVILLANLHALQQMLPVQQTAWYVKRLPTFSDALSIVRQNLFAHPYFRTSSIHTEIRKPQPVYPNYRLSRFKPAPLQVPFG